MKIICEPSATQNIPATDDSTRVCLYGRDTGRNVISVGAAIAEDIRKLGIRPDPKALDLLSIALSVIAADFSVQRKKSPDGWTRELSLVIALKDATAWRSFQNDIAAMLQFLTTDIWSISFEESSFTIPPNGSEKLYDNDCISLLSGGADSLVGAIDLVEAKYNPLVVSQTVHGDGEKQGEFAQLIGGGLTHIQFNHNAKGEGPADRDQRARSVIFLAYGTLLATTLQAYREGKRITLYVCENGFISINPPLTAARIGSLSTRTTHPVFLRRFQNLLDGVGLNVELKNPYQYQTKGEMFAGCKNQDLLRSTASKSTSCSRFRRFGFQHCGACVPCLIRRSAFHRWGEIDSTSYKFGSLSTNTRHDDVLSMAMAIAGINADGLDGFIGTSLTSVLIDDPLPYNKVIKAGIGEVETFLRSAGVI